MLQEITGRNDKSLLDFVHFDGNVFIEHLKRSSDEWETHLLDDAGFTMAGREWWKDKNIEFVKEVQVARKEKKNMFFSTPHTKLVDSGLGPITHLMVSLDYWKSVNTGKGHVRRHIVEMAEKGVREYWKYDGPIEFTHLDDRIAKAYEKKKNDELRKKKVETELDSRHIAFFKLLDYVGGLSYEDISTLVIDRDGQRKPFASRQLAEVTGLSKSSLCEFKKMLSDVQQ